MSVLKVTMVGGALLPSSLTSKLLADLRSLLAVRRDVVSSSPHGPLHGAAHSMTLGLPENK